VRCILAMIVAIAVVVMSIASLLPFLQTPCGDCLRTATYTVQESRALSQAANAWAVVGLLLLVATAAVAHMVEIRPSLTAVVCLALSVVAIAVPFVESGSGGSLLFPGATAINPMTIETGFYVFLLGAAVALLASLALVIASFPRGKQQESPRVIVPS
jgi:hypothetical protein